VDQRIPTWASYLQSNYCPICRQKTPCGGAPCNAILTIADEISQHERRLAALEARPPIDQQLGHTEPAAAGATWPSDGAPAPASAANEEKCPNCGSTDYESAPGVTLVRCANLDCRTLWHVTPPAAAGATWQQKAWAEDAAKPAPASLPATTSTTCYQSAPASGWKAREWGLIPQTGPDDKPNGVACTMRSPENPTPVVERHPEAREWWLCLDCRASASGDFKTRGDHAHPNGRGWARVLEIGIERTP